MDNSDEGSLSASATTPVSKYLLNKVTSPLMTLMSKVASLSPVATSTQRLQKQSSDSEDEDDDDSDLIGVETMLRFEALLNVRSDSVGSPSFNFIDLYKLENGSLNDLKNYCKELGLATTRVKREDLIARLHKLNTSISESVKNYLKSYTRDIETKNKELADKVSDLNVTNKNVTEELQQLRCEQDGQKNSYSNQIIYMNMALRDKEKIIHLLEERSKLQSTLSSNSTSYAPESKRSDFNILSTTEPFLPQKPHNSNNAESKPLIPNPEGPQQIKCYDTAQSIENVRDKNSSHPSNNGTNKGIRPEEQKSLTERQQTMQRQEKITKNTTVNQRSHKHQHQKFYQCCNICGQSNHLSKYCYKNPSHQHNGYWNNNYYQQPNYHNSWNSSRSSTRFKSCNICYRSNHLTRNCYFREENSL